MLRVCICLKQILLKILPKTSVHKYLIGLFSYFENRDVCASLGYLDSCATFVQWLNKFGLLWNCLQCHSSCRPSYDVFSRCIVVIYVRKIFLKTFKTRFYLQNWKKNVCKRDKTLPSLFTCFWCKGYWLWLNRSVTLMINWIIVILWWNLG